MFPDVILVSNSHCRKGKTIKLLPSYMKAILFTWLYIHYIWKNYTSYRICETCFKSFFSFSFIFYLFIYSFIFLNFCKANHGFLPPHCFCWWVKTIFKKGCLVGISNFNHHKGDVKSLGETGERTWLNVFILFSDSKMNFLRIWIP